MLKCTQVKRKTNIRTKDCLIYPFNVRSTKNLESGVVFESIPMRFSPGQCQLVMDEISQGTLVETVLA